MSRIINRFYELMRKYRNEIIVGVLVFIFFLIRDLLSRTS